MADAAGRGLPEDGAPLASAEEAVRQEAFPAPDVALADEDHPVTRQLARLDLLREEAGATAEHDRVRAGLRLRVVGEHLRPVARAVSVDVLLAARAAPHSRAGEAGRELRTQWHREAELAARRGACVRTRLDAAVCSRRPEVLVRPEDELAVRAPPALMRVPLGDVEPGQRIGRRVVGVVDEHRRRRVRDIEDHPARVPVGNERRPLRSDLLDLEVVVEDRVAVGEWRLRRGPVVEAGLRGHDGGGRIRDVQDVDVSDLLVVRHHHVRLARCRRVRSRHVPGEGAVHGVDAVDVRRDGRRRVADAADELHRRERIADIPQRHAALSRQARVTDLVVVDEDVAREVGRRHVNDVDAFPHIRVRVRRDEADLGWAGRVGDVHDVDARALRAGPSRALRAERAQVGVVPERPDVADAACDVRQLDLADELDVGARGR